MPKTRKLKRASKRPSRRKAAPRARPKAVVRRKVFDLEGQKITLESLFDYLSELLIAEKTAIDFFRIARDRTEAPDLRGSIEGYLEQAERHADLLQNAIRDLGGNPVYMSSGAQVFFDRTRALRDVDIPVRHRTAIDIENLFLIESREHLGWSFLKSMVPFLEDRSAQQTLSKLADEIEDEEDQHVDWARQTLHRVMMQRLFEPVEIKKAA